MHNHDTNKFDQHPVAFLAHTAKTAPICLDYHELVAMKTGQVVFDSKVVATLGC